MALFTGAFFVAQVSLIIVAKPFYAIFCTSCVPHHENLKMCKYFIEIVKAANFRQVSHKFSFPIQYMETSHSPSPPVESSYAQISPSQYTAFGQW